MEVAVDNLGERRFRVWFGDDDVRDEVLGFNPAAGEYDESLHNSPVPWDHGVEGEGQELPGLKENRKNLWFTVLDNIDDY